MCPQLVDLAEIERSELTYRFLFFRIGEMPEW